MIINVFNEQTALVIANSLIRRVVKHVLTEEKVICDEVNIYFVDIPFISKLHAEFFNDPSPTDCISFPIDDCEEKNGQKRLLGEVFVCPATAIAYAKKTGKDPFTETILYIVHGLLHLIGYDDLEPKAKARMRRAEARHMKKLFAEPN